MKTTLFSLLVIFACSSFAQVKHEYIYKNPTDSTYNCYLKILPETEKVKGLIVRDYTRLPDINRQSPFELSRMALKNGFAVLYVNTSNIYPELYFENEDMLKLDEMIHEVVQAHTIPAHNIFIGGISASGTRALRYTAFCEQGLSRYGIEIAGVFAVDSPLDMERFYNSSKHILERNSKNGMLWESNLMNNLLEEELGGTPQQFPEKYHNASVYSYALSNGGNAVHYLEVPIIMYHEPDLNWWIEERSATLMDINSFDIMGFVSELRTRGHQDVTLIETTGKGFDHNGRRKPHSWTIVDEEQLMDWILAHCN